MFSSVFRIVFFAAAAWIPPTAGANGFLKTHRFVPGASADGFQAIMDAAHGCGTPVSKQHMQAIGNDLLPTWTVLPKDEHGRIEWHSLRYLTHRHFMKVSSLRVRGFEPSNPVNHTHLGMAHVLSQQVPSFSEGVSPDQRFTLEDASSFVAALEQVIFDAETLLLHTVFDLLYFPADGRLSFASLGEVLDTYVLHWIVGEEAVGRTTRQLSSRILNEVIPMWDMITDFLRGEIQALKFARWRQPLRHTGREVLSEWYTFADAHAVIGAISRSFAAFYQDDCIAMHQILSDLDTKKTGRVPLPIFYRKGDDSDGRFGESEDYLRALGALDESSFWNGKQVVISNYLQASSNCVVSTPHYQLCCPDICEHVLRDLEVAIGSAEASPEQVFDAVTAMTIPSLGGDLDDEEVLVKIDGGLVARLKRLSEMHGGTVLLHGRLFAQWLHYMFPQVCPYPHRAGTTSTLGVTEYKGSYAETDEVMAQRRASVPSESLIEQVNSEGLEWMSQWTDEEQLADAEDSRGGRFFNMLLFGSCAILVLTFKRWSPLATDARDVSHCKKYCV